MLPSPPLPTLQTELALRELKSVEAESSGVYHVSRRCGTTVPAVPPIYSAGCALPRPHSAERQILVNPLEAGTVSSSALLPPPLRLGPKQR